jgi:hypothetical protein
MAIIL